jgi:hypothetical protein
VGVVEEEFAAEDAEGEVAKEFGEAGDAVVEAVE